MKEITLPVSQFEAQCLRLLDDVEKNGDRIVTWEGLVEVKGDIVHFSDHERESDSD